ncbi:MAG: hypothetical protein ACREEW_16870 [Caulobacteraceae bacterium]
MPVPNDPARSADAGLGKVDRGQRVARETEMGECHDGKERAHFAHPMHGRLPADMHGAGATPSPITVEDVVEVTETASAWEAIEDEADIASD